MRRGSHESTGQKRRPGIWMREVPEPEVGPTTCSSGSRRRRSAAPTCISTTGMRGRRRRSRCRWPWGTNIRADRRNRQRGRAASRPATAFPAKVTSPAATAAIAARDGATCAATRRVSASTGRVVSRSISRPGRQRIQAAGAIPDDIASILDPFGNATHTALSFDLVGEDVLITGAGPIGIMAVAIASTWARATSSSPT